jgi:hypothetical protein
VGRVRFRISISLDGYTAGPEQSRKAPLGIGGEQLRGATCSAAIRDRGIRRSRGRAEPLTLQGGTTFTLTPISRTRCCCTRSPSSWAGAIGCWTRS